MKSGAVNTDKDRKYYEPEVWRFGESPYKGGATNYMRHASGQIYGMSAALATYLARSGDVLHRFANEDVTVGAWLVGLEVEHLHEPRFCCQGRDSCQGQVGGPHRMAECCRGVQLICGQQCSPWLLACVLHRARDGEPQNWLGVAVPTAMSIAVCNKVFMLQSPPCFMLARWSPCHHVVITRLLQS